MCHLKLHHYWQSDLKHALSDSGWGRSGLCWLISVSGEEISDSGWGIVGSCWLISVRSWGKSCLCWGSVGWCWGGVWSCYTISGATCDPAPACRSVCSAPTCRGEWIYFTENRKQKLFSAENRELEKWKIHPHLLVGVGVLLEVLPEDFLLPVLSEHLLKIKIVPPDACRFLHISRVCDLISVNERRVCI